MENIITKAWRGLMRILVYEPPADAPPFVLEEPKYESSPKSSSLETKAGELNNMVRRARELEAAIRRTHQALKAGDNQTVQDMARSLRSLSDRTPSLWPQAGHDNLVNSPVSPSLEENIKTIRALYHLPLNKDVVVRRFTMGSLDAVLIYMDGLVSREVINLSVLEPLMKENFPKEDGETLDKIVAQILPSDQVRTNEKFPEIVESINFGDAALFIEGAAKAIIVAVRGPSTRSPGRPENEQTVRGPQVALTEVMRVNTALIRLYLPTCDLVTEMVAVGKRAPVKCAVMYLKSIANPNLVAEVKRRMEGVVIDTLTDAAVLEQLIEDNPSLPLPQSLSTERPDRAAVSLTEGRVAIIVDGTPFAIVVPVTFPSFFHSPEDFSLKLPLGSFMRILRILGTVLSVLLPAVYLAINYFHQEAMPTELMLAIAGAREAVPFPALIEILIMELAFEFIREAGLRIPGVLGSTIGIVGAIILGQAAVAANIVSPIMVVIVAVSGMGSFTIPDYRMSMALRIARFIFIMLAAYMGLVALALGMAVLGVMMCSLKSFGVPYMAPLGPKTMSGLDIVVRGPQHRQERRPDVLNPQDDYRQPKISRKWLKRPPVGSEDE